MTTIDLDLPDYATSTTSQSWADRRSALTRLAQGASVSFWQACGAAGAMALVAPPAEDHGRR